MREPKKYDKSEARLRDFIAAHLEMIEVHLKLVQVEYPVKNAEGAKGFIDILARDVFGHRVVIEIKRSDATARQALHELHKYVELLRKNQGLSNAEVRCILVSTDWHELGVPFDAFRRAAPYSVEGYRVTDDGRASFSFNKINSLEAPLSLQPFRLHIAFLFMTKKRQQAFISRLDQSLTNTGVSSAAILSMSSKSDRNKVMYPFCVYLMICDVTASVRQRLEKKAKKEVLDGDSQYEINHMFEDLLDAEVTHATRGGWDTLETSYPEKLSAELPQWNIEQLKRTGRLADDRIVTDDDIFQHLLGHTGTGQISYDGMAIPAFPAAWNAAKDRVRRCLQGNDVWLAVAEHAFQEIESQNGVTRAAFHVYNPCDAVMMLYQLRGNDDPRFIPAMEIFWENNTAQTRSIISGFISWDGKTTPTNPIRLLSKVYDGDDSDYFLARTVGAVADFDGKVMSRHGLSYRACKWSASGGEADGIWLSVSGKVVTEARRITKHSMRKRADRPLPEFLKENDKYLSGLVKWFRSLCVGA